MDQFGQDIHPPARLQRRGVAPQIRFVESLYCFANDTLLQVNITLTCYMTLCISVQQDIKITRVTIRLYYFLNNQRFQG